MRFLRKLGGGGLASAAALLAHEDTDTDTDGVAAAAAALAAAAGARAEEQDRAAAEDDAPGKVVVAAPDGGQGGEAESGDAPDDDLDPEKDKKKGGDEGAAPAGDAAQEAARAEGFAAGTERCLTVMQSEHFAGRESLAAELLGSDMAADRIVGALAKAAKGGTDTMLGNLSQQQNPQLGAGREAAGNKAESQASWNRTLNRLGFTKKN